jgi:2-haloacid dehalogenase
VAPRTLPAPHVHRPGGPTAVALPITRDHTHLLLDLDGTVLDFLASQHHALRTVATDLGVAWDDAHAETYSRINAVLWEAYERGEIEATALRSTRWRRFLEELEVDADPERADTDYLTAFAAGAHLVDGALEVVATLAERMTVVAVTNGFGDVQHERLERSGLRRHLAGVVVSDEVGAAKPQPEIFDAAFAVAGDPPRDRVAIVGDSLTSDIAGGRAYGITTVWVNPSGAGHAPHPAPDAVVAHVAELL